MELNGVKIIMIYLLFISCHQNRNEEEINKINLGHRFFFDKNISINNTKSCASCHSPEYAFTDGYRTSITSMGENLQHNAPTLLNVSELHYFDWANPSVTTLKKQIERPLFGHSPIELGLDKHWNEFKQYLKEDSNYSSLIKKAFNKNEITKNELIECLVIFEKQLKSTNNKYAKYLQGDENILNSEQKMGLALVQAHCTACHGGDYFTNASLTKNKDSIYYSILQENTTKYKTPTLLNINLTAPYLHNGSISSLDSAILIHKNITLSHKEINRVIQFLETLTDTSYMQNDLFQDPF